VVTLSVCVFLAVWSKVAHGHSDVIVQCQNNLKVDHVTLVREWVNENGTLSEGYDRNEDGKVDIEAISYARVEKQDSGVVVVSHHPFPFLYVVDLDYDGEPDAVYVDRHVEGRCDDVVPYLDLHDPAPRGERWDRQKEGRL
jgi:hypothetical protein